MFKPSPSSYQHDLFSSNHQLLSGKSLTQYEDDQAWHNVFRREVTMGINETLFKPLYSSSQGSPNASIRVMVAMMVLKEAQGLSDEKLFEDCRFNALTRSALGLHKVDDPLPTESTYYLFRKQVADYAQSNKVNLFDEVFTQISKEQSLAFQVSGKRVRMDSKLLGSNIAWLSRYELVHETVRLFYKVIKKSPLLSATTATQLDELLKLKGNKVVYTLEPKEVKDRLSHLGELIAQLLVLFSDDSSKAYTTLKQVFREQFEVTGQKVVLRKNEEISAKTIQSPHDTDADYRNKDGTKIKGYSINVTESCDDDQDLNLIGSVDVKTASTADVDFFENGIRQAEEVFVDEVEDAHADGAYHSTENQQFCTDHDIDLHLHAIQGARSRYQLNPSEAGNDIVSVVDTQTNVEKQVTKFKGRDGSEKWRIKTEAGTYRYFTQKDIDTATIRKKIAETSTEILQKRNNVEATIFQLAYHYANSKSRYRSLNRHQMWANMRCLWMNFVRILNYLQREGQKVAAYLKNSIGFLLDLLFMEPLGQFWKRRFVFCSRIHLQRYV